ncbi:MAG: DNA adenine methylase [Clostridia bacterium]|nr:DNA adenine methylase [Clostridia bacterium]
MDYIATTYIPSKQKVKSPLRYPGGKFYALKHIMPYIDCVPHDEYREPFLGGGSVFFAKEKAQYNILNDLETDIIRFFNAIKNSDTRIALAALMNNEVATRSRHAEVKAMVPKTPLQEVFKTYYLNRTSYSGIINMPAWGYADGKSAPPSSWGKFLFDAAPKLEGVDLFSLDFMEIIKMPARGKTVLMYLDPPYYHTDQKRAYTKPFTVSDHIRLSEALKQTDFLFCLSYDNCPEVRELYNWANLYDVSWLYNTDNKPGQSRKHGNELIITNYSVVHK